MKRIPARIESRIELIPINSGQNTRIIPRMIRDSMITNIPVKKFFTVSIWSPVLLARIYRLPRPSLGSGLAMTQRGQFYFFFVRVRSPIAPITYYL